MNDDIHAPTRIPKHVPRYYLGATTYFRGSFYSFLREKEILLYYYIIILSGVRLSPLGAAATSGLLYQPQMIGEGDCGAIGGMKIGRGNRSIKFYFK
jgi:hypothetical protein